MQIFEGFLPNCLDEGDGHEAAGNEFEDGSKEDADEATPACFESICELLAGNEFAEDSAYERAKDDTYGAKEKSHKDADCTTPHAPFRSAVMLGAPCRHNIVQDGDDDDYNAPNKEELPGEIHLVCGLCDPQASICNRRAWKPGYDTAYNSYQDKEKGDD